MSIHLPFLEQSQALLDAALQSSQGVEIEVATKGEAQTLRMKLYQSRKRLIELEAKAQDIPRAAFQSPYATLLMKVVPKDKKFAVKIIPVRKSDFTITDIKTGAQIDVNTTAVSEYGREDADSFVDVVTE